MLPEVSIPRFQGAPTASLRRYRGIADDEVLDEILLLARDLKGLRVCHVNSTPYGGGVAELLTRTVPLSRSLGIDAEWRVLLGNPGFFAVTKAIHNALQGARSSLTPADRERYLEVNRNSAALLKPNHDLYVVHDPQPAALRHFIRRDGARWLWRCHIDTSSPDPEAAAFLFPFVASYDAAIFTMEPFVPAGIPLPRTVFIPPAIDPLSTKNMPLPDDVARSAVASSGIDPGRPWVLQVSRFDPWKDPLGVVEAFRLARKSVPGLQLALVGSMAGDDPEGSGLLARLEEEIAEDPDIHVMTNLSGVGNMEVNAFQRAADLVIQKSLREGFGLVVSESFWKGRAMVCGRAGGIPMQYPPEFQRYLVDSVEGCAERMVELLRDPDRRREFGRAAKEHVRRRFLLPRLLRDELRLFRTTMAGPKGVPADSGDAGGILTPASGGPARPTPGMPMP